MRNFWAKWHVAALLLAFMAVDCQAQHAVAFNGRLSSGGAKSSPTGNRSLRETSQLFRNQRGAAAPSGALKTAGLKSAPDERLIVVDAPASIQLVQVENAGSAEFLYAAPSFEVSAGSSLRNWVLFMVATDAVSGNGGVIPAGELDLKLVTPSTTRNLKLDRGQELVSGGQTSAITFNMTLSALLNASQPEGTYCGELRFYTPGEVRGQILAVTRYCIEVKASYELEVDSNGLLFGEVQPFTDKFADSPSWIKVTSNQALTFQISLVGIEQSGGDGSIPPGNVAIAGGATTYLAHANLGDYGDTAFLWKPSQGTHTLFIDGKMQVNLDVPAGAYRGIIQVVCQSK